MEVINSDTSGLGDRTVNCIVIPSAKANFERTKTSTPPRNIPKNTNSLTYRTLLKINVRYSKNFTVNRQHVVACVLQIALVLNVSINFETYQLRKVCG